MCSICSSMECTWYVRKGCTIVLMDVILVHSDARGTLTHLVFVE